jgi:hypothetical protein
MRETAETWFINESYDKRRNKRDSIKQKGER